MIALSSKWTLLDLFFSAGSNHRTTANPLISPFFWWLETNQRTWGQYYKGTLQSLIITLQSYWLQSTLCNNSGVASHDCRIFIRLDTVLPLRRPPKTVWQATQLLIESTVKQQVLQTSENFIEWTIRSWPSDVRTKQSRSRRLTIRSDFRFRSTKIRSGGSCWPPSSSSSSCLAPFWGGKLCSTFDRRIRSLDQSTCSSGWTRDINYIKKLPCQN